MNFSSTIQRLQEVAKRYIPSKEVYPTLYHSFDKAMDGGLREGDLVVISGVTGEGKTEICRNLTINFSKQTVPTLWFSYEEDPFYLLENFKKLEFDTEKLLAYAPIELISNELDFIEQEVKEATSKKAVKIVIIDHLHYLIPLKQSINSSLLIGGIVRELKKMAIRNKIVLFLIAHTRKVNVGDELNLSSIRDSGLIANEADYVFLIERRRKKKSPREKLESDYLTGGEVFYNQSRVTLAKNRRTGKILYMDFGVKNGKFIPIAKEYDETIF